MLTEGEMFNKLKRKEAIAALLIIHEGRVLISVTYWLPDFTDAGAARG